MSIASSKILLLIALLGIIVFAFAPGKWTPAWVVNHDKFSHMVVFFVLALLLKPAFPKINTLKQVSLLIAFAITIELMQLLFFNRGFSSLDLIYDLFGIGLFVAFMGSAPFLAKVYLALKGNDLFKTKLNKETIE